ncbi:peptide chain release factor N(5)-glutamine methyltransferase [Sulfurimonas diazotrophicus]|uniref:peptide chain release factor N(5)-glutamine methyltransferase n=1 Tax=Sulfurimonas diazotrophicus TaxID=3131939 RepID=A0ABZ3HBR3_9BACT
MGERVRTLRECLDVIAAEIAVSAERPRREAERMLMEYLGRDGLWLITHQDEPLSCDERLWEWVARRKAHEPLEYIFNRVSFYSQLFYIAPGALIPRPETELLIDRVLEAVDPAAEMTLCEVGVGSGAVSVTLALHLEQAQMIGVDISEEALGVAAKNVADFGLQERIELRQSDLLAGVPENIDVLVSNPPYVAEDAALERNLDYEPDLALFGGVTGMDIIVRLIDAVAERKIPLFCCEMGYDQREAVSAIVPKGYTIDFYKDLAGLDRGFVMTRKDET